MLLSSGYNCTVKIDLRGLVNYYDFRIQSITIFIANFQIHIAHIIYSSIFLVLLIIFKNMLLRTSALNFIRNVSTNCPKRFFFYLKFLTLLFCYRKNKNHCLDMREYYLIEGKYSQIKIFQNLLNRIFTVFLTDRIKNRNCKQHRSWS